MADPAERQARCSCGALTATARGDPAVVAMCSCRACQRRTGSAFALFAWWPAEAVAVDGETRRWARTSDRGRTWEEFFCPTCGATVLFRGEHLPGRTGIAAGAFADPAFPPPVVAVWDTTRHHWLDGIADLPRLQEQRT